MRLPIIDDGLLKPMMTMMMGETRTTRMEPSSSGSSTDTATDGRPPWARRNMGRFSSALRSTSAATTAEGDNEDIKENSGFTATAQPPTFVPRLVESDLYALPDSLQATYRPLDWFTRSWLTGIVGSLVLVGDATVQSRKVRQFVHLFFSRRPLQALTELVLAMKRASWRTTRQWVQWTAGFLIKALLLQTFCTMVLQDLFLRPSRVSTAQLQSHYVLPSPLSKFREISAQSSVPTNASTSWIGVHWLEYHRSTRNDKTVFTNTTGNDAPKSILYCNHGFGASSLSWLPSLKVLTEALHCHTGLAHDALGFGFSEAFRSTNDNDDDNDDLLYWYTWEGSAQMAQTLLEPYALSHHRNDTVVLMGHSMGALTTLYMALHLKEIPKRIVLVAPALGVRRPSQKSTRPRQGQSWLGKRSLPWERPAKYILRRAVGRPGFWKTCLTPVWGNAQRLQDTDVLRFQWPSIHEGWEDGLVRFTKAVMGSNRRRMRQQQDSWPGLSDQELLVRVLALPHTSIEVIVGEKDRILSPGKTRRFFEAFPQIPVTELAGLGHDPFEEDVDSFVQALN